MTIEQGDLFAFTIQIIKTIHCCHVFSFPGSQADPLFSLYVIDRIPQKMKFVIIPVVENKQLKSLILSHHPQKEQCTLTDRNGCHAARKHFIADAVLVIAGYFAAI